MLTAAASLSAREKMFGVVPPEHLPGKTRSATQLARLAKALTAEQALPDA